MHSMLESASDTDGSLLLAVHFRCRDRASAWRRESNPRFFKAEIALASVLAHVEISLRDTLHIKYLCSICDSAPGTDPFDAFGGIAPPLDSRQVTDWVRRDCGAPSRGSERNMACDFRRRE
jgi:hypothetical protein